MFLTLLAAAVAAATPAPSTAAIDKAVTSVCIARFAENVALVENGDEPRSLVIPLMDLDDATAAALTTRCDMFDRGIAFAMTVKPTIRVPATTVDREGLAPDHSNDLSTLRR